MPTQIEAVDNFNNRAVQSQGWVSLELQADTAGAELRGTTEQIMVDGYSAFADLRVYGKATGEMSARVFGWFFVSALLWVLVTVFEYVFVSVSLCF